MTVTPPTRPEPGGYAVSLLGGFELRHEDRTVTATPAAQRLLAYIATRPKRVNRVATARALWPDFTDTRAAANLRSALWRLRRQDDGGPVRSTARGLELHPATVVDIHVVRAQTAALSSASEQVPDLDPVVLRHDVLPEWTDEWLLPTREWFRQIRLHALEAL